MSAGSGVSARRDYDWLAEERPRTIRDHTARWDRLQPVESLNGRQRERIDEFCASKRIDIASLTALGTRSAVRRGGGLWLAFAGRNADGVVTAIKYRPLGGSSHDSESEPPSVWQRPIVVGNTTSLDWIIAEGETDAARLVGLVGDGVAVMCLPTGALAFQPEWAAIIPRGATVYTCHDADHDGDEGAKRVERLVGRVVRVRPPDDASDWCEWTGGREEFVRLVSEAKAAITRVGVEFIAADEFASIREPDAAAVVVDADGSTVVPSTGVVLMYGDGGAGKTTLTLDGVCHFVAGVEWLGGLLRPVRPLVVGWIENEGPSEEFRRKVERKLADWHDRLDPGRLVVMNEPWARFTLREETHRAELAAEIERHGIELLVAGPLSSLGMVGGGTPDDITAFLEFVGDLQARLPRPIAIIILHHENRAGQVSGAWEGRPELLVHVQAQGRGHVRVFWQKARWSSALHATTSKLIWADGDGFNLAEEDLSRPERVWDDIAEYVLANGGCSWNDVDANVTGTADYMRLRRDQMIDAGVLVNTGKGRGFVLWHVDDPQRPVELDGVRRPSDAPADAPASFTGGGEDSVGASVRRHVSDDAPTDDAPPGAFDADDGTS